MSEKKERENAYITIRIKQSAKTKLVKAAKAKGVKLSRHIKDLLNI